MEIFGIGPFELLIILLIALLFLGPGDMVKAGRTLGRFLRKIITSSEWQTIQKASRELKYLPNWLMREASLEDLSKDITEINQIGKDISRDIKSVDVDLSSWITPPESIHSKQAQPSVEDGSSDLPDFASKTDSSKESV